MDEETKIIVDLCSSVSANIERLKNPAIPLPTRGGRLLLREATVKKTRLKRENHLWTFVVKPGQN